MFENNNYRYGVTTKQMSLTDLCTRLEIVDQPIVHLDQVHGAAFIEVTQKNLQDAPPACDAAFTRLPKISIAIRTADCLPILFWHPSGLIGGIHAGRKSTMLEITKKMFHHFKDSLKLESGFEIWFGPAICEQCYQIDPILDQHYDLISENLKQLFSVISPDHNQIVKTNTCTSCQNDLYYSYRKEKTALRLYSVISRNL